MIDVNIRVLTDLTLRYLPGMVAAKAGGVINVSSVAGFMPGPMMAVYFATKNYVLSFGEALSEELKGTGVTITTLCPGIVKTGFQARAGMPEVRSRRVTPRDVETEAWEGHKLQRRVVIPGFFNKISAYGMRLAPRSLVLPVVKRVMGKRR
jgi:short-subunit dehydrogenase